MIVEIKHKSGSAGRCLGYDFGDMLDKDQVAKVLMAGNLFLSPTTARRIAEIPVTAEDRKRHKKEVHEIAKRIGLCFDNLAAKADSRVRTPYVEYIISFAEGEHVPVKKKKEIIKDYLEKMGVLNNDLMYVVTAHDSTNCEHVHVFCNRVNITTRKVYAINQDYIKSNKICDELNKKYNLVTKVENHKRNRAKTNVAYLSKIDAAQAVREALQVAISQAQLVAALAKVNVTLEVKPRGYVFTVKSADGVTHHWSGAQLGKDLTRPKMEAVLESNRVAAEAKKKAEAVKMPLNRERFLAATAHDMKPNAGFVERGKSGYLGIIETAKRKVCDAVHSTFDKFLHAAKITNVNIASMSLSKAGETITAYADIQMPGDSFDEKYCLTLSPKGELSAHTVARDFSKDKSFRGLHSALDRMGVGRDYFVAEKYTSDSILAENERITSYSVSTPYGYRTLLECSCRVAGQTTAEYYLSDAIEKGKEMVFYNDQFQCFSGAEVKENLHRLHERLMAEAENEAEKRQQAEKRAFNQALEKAKKSEAKAPVPKKNLGLSGPR